LEVSFSVQRIVYFVTKEKCFVMLSQEKKKRKSEIRFSFIAAQFLCLADLAFCSVPCWPTIGGSEVENI
jgi:hypothetical protein